MLLVLLFISIFTRYQMSPDPVFNIDMLQTSHKIIEVNRFFTIIIYSKGRI